MAISEEQRLQLLQKHAQMLQEEMEELNRGQMPKDKDTSRLEIGELDETETAELQQTVDGTLVKLAHKRIDKQQGVLLTEFEEEVKTKGIKRGSREMVSLMDKYKQRGLDFGRVVIS